MISDKEKSIIVEVAEQYGINEIILFGSNTDPSKESRDIDIAVDGIAPKDFFKFYGELMFKVSKPVDIVDLSKDNTFTRIIRKEGLVLYARSEAEA